MSEVRMRTIIGRVGTDPEISEKAGSKLAKFRLAESKWDREAKVEVTTWFDVSAWDQQAAIAEGVVRKGERIYVTGLYSVYHGDAGDREQIKAKEMGTADRFRVEDVGGEDW